MRREPTIAPVIFVATLLVFFGLCCVIVIEESGPIVLGTEREPDGRVEYLCLGRGCEDLR